MAKHLTIDRKRDAEAYRLRMETGVSWTSLAARLGVTVHVARSGAARHAERHGLPSVKSAAHSARALKGHETLRRKRVRFERKCLNCGKPFTTTGRFNRICSRTECQDLLEGGSEDYRTP